VQAVVEIGCGGRTDLQFGANARRLEMAQKGQSDNK
jgi:hypothetical protein